MQITLLPTEAVFNYFNMLNKITGYFKASLAEMKKVSWPTKKETYNYTFLVIGISLGVAAFLGALDYVFNLILQFIINRTL